MTVLGSLRPSVSRQARPWRPRCESRDRTCPQGWSVLSIKEAMELPGRSGQGLALGEGSVAFVFSGNLQKGLEIIRPWELQAIPPR